MRWRLVFVAVAVGALGVFVLMNGAAVVEATSAVFERRDLVVILAVAVCIHLIGHLLRVLRTKIVIDEVNRGSIKGQFGALAIGFLLNAVLPLRLGEVGRAIIIARTLRVSLLYTLAAVLVERLFDVILIGVAIVVVALLSAQISNALVVGAVLVIVLAVAALAAFVALVLEQRAMLGVVSRVTALLAPRARNRSRFMIWTLIFGVQRLILDRGKVWRYLGLTVASWVCYLASMLAVGLSILPPTDGGQLFVAAAYPFIAITTFWGQTPLAAYVEVIDEILIGITGSAATLHYAEATWLMLVVPMTVLGAIALFFLRFTRATQPAGVDAAFENKLRRLSDISSEMPAFLESYFQGHNLARILHRTEVTGRFSLVRFFRGGSDAVTVLALRHGAPFVKKMVPVERAEQLRAQYQWLSERSAVPGIVHVLGSDSDAEYFSIDLDYEPESEPLFDYLHRVPLGEARAKLDRAWDLLVTGVYRLEPAAESHPEVLNDYVSRYLERRVEQTARRSDELAAMLDAPELVVNGEHLPGLAATLDRIRRHPVAWSEVSRYRASVAVHGDFTIDNLLVDRASDDVVIIDPSDDNPFHAPVLDLGRLRQSLLFGYEFLVADDADVAVDVASDGAVSLEFPVLRSERYAALDRFVVSDLAPRVVDEAEVRTSMFHASLFYGRMLTHRISIAPGSAPKYLATSIVGLNRFLAQY